MSKPWFPEGADDPELLALKVSVEHAELWVSESNRMVRFFSIAKAALLGSKPAYAERHAVARMSV
jgi:hypothetical protein